MYRCRLWNLIVISLIAGLMLSCQSTQPTTMKSNSSQNSLNDANLLYQQGQYESALVKYSSYVYSPFPNKTEMASARYYMGLCQYLLKRYGEAAETMTVLLKSHPDFAMTGEAIEILNNSNAQLAAKQTEVLQQQTNQLNTLAELQKQVSQSPNNAQLHFQLGNQYWEAGEYKTAALHYEQAVLLHPEYEKDNVIRNRVYYNNNNVLVPRDPLQALQQLDDVIRLHNVRHDVRTRVDFLGRTQSIRVSGEAENVTIRTVNQVSVELTLVDFFERIQDSQTVQLGNIRPGEKKPFSVLMDQFSGSANDNLKIRSQVFFQE